MRKWHRWLSFVFGAFLLFIAITGVGSHLAAMYARGSVFESEEEERPQPPAAMEQTANSQNAGQPPAEQQRPAPNPKRKLVGLFHHLHSGEQFGPVGVIISLLSGFSMIFFSFSGLWMYFQMLTRRSDTGKKGLFWD